jgi:thiol:disulfide interchange protein
MAKEKKKLTVKQKYHRYKAAQWSFTAGEYVSVAVPYGVMAIVNRDEWFTYNPDSWKVGLGGSIGIVLLGLAMFLITKKKENDKITNGMIGLVIGWYAITFVFFLLAQINMEIYKIMAYGGFGLLAALGLEAGSKNFEKKANNLKSAMKNAQSNLDTEQATKEIIDNEKKKTKKKIVQID